MIIIIVYCNNSDYFIEDFYYSYYYYYYYRTKMLLGCQKIDYHENHCNINPKAKEIQEDLTVVGKTRSCSRRTGIDYPKLRMKLLLLLLSNIMQLQASSKGLKSHYNFIPFLLYGCPNYDNEEVHNIHFYRKKEN